MRRYVQEYDYQHSYSDSSVIKLPLRIVSGTDWIRIAGVIDTGSPFCVFERRNAAMLGLNVEDGIRRSLSTAAGSFVAFGHEVLIELFDYQREATMYFHESETFSRNILGRIGFLDHLKIGLVDYDDTLFIGLYEDLE